MLKNNKPKIFNFLKHNHRTMKWKPNDEPNHSDSSSTSVKHPNKEATNSETSETDEEPQQETLDTLDNSQPLQEKVIGKYFTKDYEQNKQKRKRSNTSPAHPKKIRQTSKNVNRNR